MSKLHVIHYSSDSDLPVSIRERVPDSVGQSIFRQALNEALSHDKSEMHGFIAGYRALELAGYHRDVNDNWIQKQGGPCGMGLPGEPESNSEDFISRPTVLSTVTDQDIEDYMLFLENLTKSNPTSSNVHVNRPLGEQEKEDDPGTQFVNPEQDQLLGATIQNPYDGRDLNEDDLDTGVHKGGPGSGPKPEAFKYRMVALVKPYKEGKVTASDIKSGLQQTHPKIGHNESLQTDSTDSRREIASNFHGNYNFPVHVYNRGDLEENKSKAKPLYTVTREDYDSYMNEPDVDRDKADEQKDDDPGTQDVGPPHPNYAGAPNYASITSFQGSGNQDPTNMYKGGPGSGPHPGRGSHKINSRLTLSKQPGSPYILQHSRNGRLAEIHVQRDGDDLHIVNIQSREGPNNLGPKVMRASLRAIVSDYPGIKTISGLHAFGRNRSGESTTINVEKLDYIAKRISGSSNIHLNKEGVALASKLGTRIADKGCFDILYSSPLNRGKETAHEILEACPHTTYASPNQALQPWHLGAFEGSD